MTSYSLRKGSAEKTKADVVVVGVVRTPSGPRAAAGGEGVASAYGRSFEPLLSTLGFKAGRGEVAKIPTGGTIKSPLLILVGLGEVEELSSAVVRRAAGVAARAISNAATAVLALPAEDADHVRAVVEGFALGAYRFDRYKSKEETPGPTEVVVLSGAARTKPVAAALETAQVVASATALARDWVNTPAGDLYPEAFAASVQDEHKRRRPARVKVTVRAEAQLAAEGFGGIIGVGQGSSHPPRLLELSYAPRGAKTHLALIGKGITFDSGGLSLKPSTGMATMKCDMSGAAAVVAATFAIAELGLPIRVSCFAPMAENMPSGTAIRPGDVLTMYDGQTVEVLNTDAEGRLVLADALALARGGQPDLMIDVATLTGACEIALGDRVGGILGNDESWAAQAQTAGARVGEAHWPLPITDDMREKVTTNSKVADLMQHNADGFGGALYAAAFLQEFVGDTRWAHFDIAGPAFNKRAPYGHVTSGGTGFAVATLVELATELAG